MVSRERFARIWVTALYVMSMLYVMAHVGLTQFPVEPTFLQQRAHTAVEDDGSAFASGLSAEQLGEAVHGRSPTCA